MYKVQFWSAHRNKWVDTAPITHNSTVPHFKEFDDAVAYMKSEQRDFPRDKFRVEQL